MWVATVKESCSRLKPGQRKVELPKINKSEYHNNSNLRLANSVVAQLCQKCTKNASVGGQVESQCGMFVLPSASGRLVCFCKQRSVFADWVAHNTGVVLSIRKQQ